MNVSILTFKLTQKSASGNAIRRMHDDAGVILSEMAWFRQSSCRRARCFGSGLGGNLLPDQIVCLTLNSVLALLQFLLAM